MPAPTARPRPSHPRALAAAAVAMLLVVGLAACGDDDDDPVTAGSGDETTVTTADAGSDTTLAGGGEEEAEGPTVEAMDFSFTSLSVAPGTEVTFENYGEKPHTMTADDGAFDSGRVEPGAKATVTAPSEPGDYAFHCEIHPQMTATLTVEG